jgi:hypothetical protein
MRGGSERWQARSTSRNIKLQRVVGFFYLLTFAIVVAVNFGINDDNQIRARGTSGVPGGLDGKPNDRLERVADDLHSHRRRIHTRPVGKTADTDRGPVRGPFLFLLRQE